MAPSFLSKSSSIAYKWDRLSKWDRFKWDQLQEGSPKCGIGYKWDRPYGRDRELQDRPGEEPYRRQDRQEPNRHEHRRRYVRVRFRKPCVPPTGSTVIGGDAETMHDSHTIGSKEIQTSVADAVRCDARLLALGRVKN